MSRNTKIHLRMRSYAIRCQGHLIQTKREAYDDILRCGIPGSTPEQRSNFLDEFYATPREENTQTKVVALLDKHFPA